MTWYNGAVKSDIIIYTEEMTYDKILKRHQRCVKVPRLIIVEGRFIVKDFYSEVIQMDCDLVPLFLPHLCDRQLLFGEHHDVRFVI